MVMTEDELNRLRYPIGRFSPRVGLTRSEVDALIDDIAALPGDLRRAVAPLTPEQLDTPYRPGGWTVRQVVHHLADSHVHSYIRFKLAITQDNPAIMSYSQVAWAELADSREEDVEASLRILEGVHRRWARFLRSLELGDFARTFRHPESGDLTLERNLQLYAWHGRHHLAHITSLRERSGW